DAGGPRPSAAELLQLLLRGGISTARSVDEVSGRGVGLDVLREAAARLGGEVTLTTEAGRGTALEIVVPISLFSLDAIVVAAARDPILVIDDSLTTRMLERSILESAGYEVELATSAEEALEMAKRRSYALFLVDVEMPGMDGYTFVARTRAEPAFAQIPAIL